ncbi:flavodoxin family protein [Alteromonadaceae bacterium M269]|nr:flavodoxin family protein [Alteromonadaceae bacterium M269]
MSKVVVISGHPNLESSNTNTVILDEVSSQLEGVQVRRLDQLYPDYQINVDEEQKALLDADIVVLQFPFYWYSVPALLKKWIDDVFSYNFAYGSQGDKLKGKDIILSFTVGGPEESYDPLGYNHFTIEQLIKPLQQTAYLAGMNFVKPIYTHRMVYIPGVYNDLDEVQGRAREHADKLIEQVNELLNSPAKAINRFIQQWFADFDVLPDDSERFTRYLTNDVKLVMTDGEYLGHEGFRDWYQTARSTFKPDCQHIVEQVSIQELSATQHQVELRVRLIADSYPESSLKGESINLLVNESWKVSISDDQAIQIQEYIVTPVDG